MNDVFDVNELLQPQYHVRPERFLDSPAKIGAAFLAFPGLWLILLAVGQFRKSSPDAARARLRRRACPDFLHGLAKIRPNNDGAMQQLDALLQEFLAARFDMQAGTITFSDVKPCLANENVPGKIQDDLRTLMEACVAVKYGGAASAHVSDEILEKGRATIKSLA